MMRPSKIGLKVGKGVVSDFSIEDLPEAAALESFNGRFVPELEGGAFKWTSVKGEKIIPITGGGWVSTRVINKYEHYKGSLICFSKDTTSGSSYIHKLVPTYSTTDNSIAGFAATTLVYDQYNAYLQINNDVELIKIRIITETDTIYTIYWTDGVTSLKSLRIINGTGQDGLTSVDFASPISYGPLEFVDLIDGSLPGGAMFYSYRLKGNNGAVTDWSMAMGPVIIPNKRASATRTWEDYHTIRHAKKDEVSACGVRVKISNIDTDFEYLQLMAIVSNENGTYDNAYICKEVKILNQSPITLDHKSDFSNGSVPLEEAMIATQAITLCTDFEIVNNIMIILSPSVDNALLTGVGAITHNKVTGATVSAGSRKVYFDTSNANLPDTVYANPQIGFLAESITYNITKYKDQVTGNPVTTPLSTGADYVGYKNPRVATLMRNCWRYETYRVGIVPVSNYGKRLGARHCGDLVIPVQAGAGAIPLIEEVNSVQMGGLDVQMANVVNLILGNIDITQWVHEDVNGVPISCDIQGFHVVVAPRDKTILHEGVLFSSALRRRGDNNLPYEYALTGGNTEMYRMDSPEHSTLGPAFTQAPVRNLYQYYSPDVQNENLIKEKNGSHLRIEQQLAGQFINNNPTSAEPTWDYPGYNSINMQYKYKGANDGFTPYHWSSGEESQKDVLTGPRVWNKYYHRFPDSFLNDDPTFLFHRDPSLHEVNEVVEFMDLDAFNPGMSHEEQTHFINALGQRKFINAYWGHDNVSINGGLMTPAGDCFGGGSPTRVMVTKTIENDTNSYNVNPYATLFTNGVTVVSSIINNAEPYGGISDNALAQTAYRSCWHYQEITIPILQAIKKPVGGLYVFDDMEIFIGDSYIIPHAFSRINHAINYGNELYPIVNPNMCNYLANALIAPLQSNLNSCMSEGDRWLKERSLRAFLHPTNEQDAYTGIGVYSIPLSVPYGRLEHFNYPTFANVAYGQNLYFALPENIFYTDNYPMRFAWSLRKIDAEQEDAFRQFPFANYQSVQGDTGLPVAIRSALEYAVIFFQNAIGIVPVDERSVINDKSGQSLNLGRTEGVGKLVYVDKNIGTMHPHSISQLGENYTWFDFTNKDWMLWLKGQQIVSLSRTFKFRKEFLTTFNTLDLTIHTFFNQFNEVVFYQKNADNRMAMVFDYRNNIFQGRRTITFRTGIVLNTIPVLTDGVSLMVPETSVQKTVGGNFVQTKLTIVANQDPITKKMWDSFRMTGSNFKEIILTNNNASPKSVTISLLDVNKVLQKISLVEFLDNTFVGEVPLTADFDYLRGYCMKIELVAYPDTLITEFSSLIMNVRTDIE